MLTVTISACVFGTELLGIFCCTIISTLCWKNVFKPGALRFPKWSRCGLVSIIICVWAC